MENNEKKVLLSLKNVEVKFNVRGRILTAIRNVSLDIYEHENLAIVGESGSGKSVLTKTFAGMLDSNGFIPQGSIIFSDDEISRTEVKLTPANKRMLARVTDMLNKNSPLERGAAEYRQIVDLKEAIIQGCDYVDALKGKVIANGRVNVFNSYEILAGRDAVLCLRANAVFGGKA